MNLLDKYLRRVTEPLRVEEKYNYRKFVDKIDRIIDDKELFEERAAVMEYDGGLSRDDAEREAVRLLY